MEMIEANQFRRVHFKVLYSWPLGNNLKVWAVGNCQFFFCGYSLIIA